jgi:hypothetical protein
MGAHPLLSNQTPLYSLQWTDMRAYLKLQSNLDLILDTTVHLCDLCGLEYGGFDLLMHLHFVHNLAYSDICPCNDCIVVQLKEALAGDWQHISEFSESSGQVVNGMHVVQRRNLGAATNVRKTQQQYTLVKASPSLSSPAEHAAKEALARQETLARMESASVIRIDSLSPALQQSSQFASVTPSQSKKKLTPVKKSQHSRVDSALSMQSMPAPPAVAKRSQPVRGKLMLVPERVIFYRPNNQISEKNLPYEISKIEGGEMWHDNGKVIWTEKKGDPLTWVDGNGNILKSVVTGLNMRWIDFLPHNIPNEVQGWQIACWFREAASQGITLKYQDLIDRGLKLSSSGIGGRMHKWQSGVGILSQTRATFHNWPSKQAMDTIAGLTYRQATFNTWWDVEFLPSHGGWMARQPENHTGYKDWVSIMPGAAKTEMPYYFIENPETRSCSEYVKLVDDAMLFLTIKAEECGMLNGYHELLHWFGRPAEDQWTLDLDADLIIEFGRWREGCHDTLSVAILRAALEQAGSVAEIEAIKRADYSLTPWLQDVDRGLAPFKQSRRSKDARKKTEVTTKVAKRVSGKRKIGEVDGVEMGGGEAKKRAMDAVMSMYG